MPADLRRQARPVAVARLGRQYSQAAIAWIDRHPLSAAVPARAAPSMPGRPSRGSQSGWGDWPPGPGLTVPFLEFGTLPLLPIHLCGQASTSGRSRPADRTLLGFRIDGGADQTVAGIYVNTSSVQPRSLMAGSLIVRGVAAGLPDIVGCGADGPAAAGDSLHFQDQTEFNIDVDGRRKRTAEPIWRERCLDSGQTFLVGCRR